MLSAFDWTDKFILTMIEFEDHTNVFSEATFSSKRLYVVLSSGDITSLYLSQLPNWKSTPERLINISPKPYFYALKYNGYG